MWSRFGKCEMGERDKVKILSKCENCVEQICRRGFLIFGENFGTKILSKCETLAPKMCGADI